MTALPQISEAEFEVMKIVWKYAPVNTNEITFQTSKERERLVTYFFTNVVFFASFVIMVNNL